MSIFHHPQDYVSFTKWSLKFLNLNFQFISFGETIISSYRKKVLLTDHSSLDPIPCPSVDQQAWVLIRRLQPDGQ